MAASSDFEKRDKVYRVLEFYSGIGGMHYAAKACGLKTNVVAAFEINTTANSVYKHNFPETSLCQRNIEGLSTSDLDKMNADVILMSPPCQPFTRVGLKGASSDPRCKSFLHILDLISKLSHPPDYILMENVKGFEESDTREQFINTLKEKDYTYQEFLLSPNQFGIPNSRLRYYMLAKRKPHQFYFSTQPEQVINQIPPVKNIKLSNGNHQSACSSCNNTTDVKHSNLCKDNSDSLSTSDNNHVPQSLENKQACTCPSSTVCKPDQSESTVLNQLGVNNRTEDNSRNEWTSSQNVDRKKLTLLEYLEKGESEECFSQFLLPEKVLSRFALVLDIVTPASTHSCCFTKAYGHYAEGTGSVLRTADIDDTAIFNEYRALGTEASDSQRAAVLSDLRLRYFTPREVANIMKFPKSFGFPQDISVKQRYRLLGNSLNVHVVTELLKCLFR
ncbi:tRNA (cytosine(38)-C(5))-methyltransferase-like [Actinia tenebrosa]|uniref:tRNA (cytosine(38)-C(5))-methyltransferase n=1 Tax=Actinia tenebrosa TaxID=6105 RepID=A0A6P8IYY0_ACTTE|nr:tRNA (cytosine(38)-C(5))-methyltransferase-like [Actinia tenebrosa]